ncbi:hypothetical protein AB7B85_29475 [Klebsiella pneumoniae]
MNITIIGGMTYLFLVPDTTLIFPRSTFTGNDWEFERSKSKTAFATLEQKFSNSWKLKFSTLQNWRNADR